MPRYIQRFLIIPVFLCLCVSFVSAKGQNEKSAYETYLSEDDPDLERSLPPVFSVQHGFFDKPFFLGISSCPEGGIIRYTLDGSDPRNSRNSIESASPVTVMVDPESSEGKRGKTPGFIVRACTAGEGLSLSPTVTQSYFFVSKAAELQKEKKAPGPGWPAPTQIGQWIDYQLDPDITEDPECSALIDDALLAIPTVSLVTDSEHMFSLKSGIFMHADKRGREWERPASLELVLPDGREGFQINSGVRIRGGWSRHPDNPKHAFRIYFREEYGPAKLDYPLFGDEATDKFNKIDIRTSQNYSWSYKEWNGIYNTMNRDVFSHDLQKLSGQPYTRSRYCHLYINGLYWGIFQFQERADASFASDYLGGNPDDYDVVKPEILDDYSYSGIEASDGTLEAWKAVWDLTREGLSSNENYFRLQGRNPDGSRNPDYPVLVDVENLTDFMNVIFFAGNFDAPTNAFTFNKMPRNFFAVYNRKDDRGFRFIIHDAEHTLNTMRGIGPGTVGLRENRVDIGFRTDQFRMTVSRFDDFHPQWLHFRLAENAEFRILMADRAYRLFFNDGPMTPERSAELFLSSAQQLETAIIAESARWGDSKYSRPRTKTDWKNAVDDIVENYFPYRTDIVIKQLRDVHWYPEIDPPLFTINGNIITSDSFTQEGVIQCKLVNTNNSGSIFYALDGSDPRLIGGKISASALNGGSNAALTIRNTTAVRARVWNGTEWSALHEIQVISSGTSTACITVTEIHYHPLKGEEVDDDEYEFIELKNTGTETEDMTGCCFADKSIRFTFPAGFTIAPGQFVVLASNSAAFNSRYGFSPHGEYEGQLSNRGEKLTLLTASGETIFSFRYDDKDPWPPGADGKGYSLVRAMDDADADPGSPQNWKQSAEIGGNPGRE
ncbi:MAG: CotH kinase family protein [Spirochaetales bacterium]|nr:CotH kinase family protein [Spirochaetales bacterium]